ncbi:hypothetical protein D3C74_367150 [compost metagenome]
MPSLMLKLGPADRMAKITDRIHQQQRIRCCRCYELRKRGRIGNFLRCFSPQQVNQMFVSDPAFHLLAAITLRFVFHTSLLDLPGKLTQFMFQIQIIDGLAYVFMYVILNSGPSILKLLITGQQNNFTRFTLLSQQPNEFQSIHGRHPNIA